MRSRAFYPLLQVISCFWRIQVILLRVKQVDICRNHRLRRILRVDDILVIPVLHHESVISLCRQIFLINIIQFRGNQLLQSLPAGSYSLLRNTAGDKRLHRCRIL